MLQSSGHPAVRNWTDLTYEVDKGFGSRFHIGMVVIDCDQTLSHEARAMISAPGIALYECRIGSSSDTAEKLSVELLQNTFNGLDLALAQINSRRPSDVVALGCTSAAMVIGPDELKRRVSAVHPGASVTDPFTGIVAALKAVGAKRVGYISPYPRDVAEKMIGQIEEHSYEVPVASGFRNESGVVRFDSPFITPASVSDAVRHLVRQDDIDTVVVSCTQMRVADVIAPLEAETGKTVISSNQALCWHALRLAGYTDEVEGFGKLFRLPIAV